MIRTVRIAYSRNNGWLNSFRSSLDFMGYLQIIYELYIIKKLIYIYLIALPTIVKLFNNNNIFFQNFI